MPKTITPVWERISSKTVVDESTGCWVYKGHKNRDGYGRIFYEGNQRECHRVVWELVFGVIPAGLCVCHKCDNPPCINPKHLFLGTHGDNTRDKMSKGRQRSLVGEDCPRSKLRNEDIIQIRSRYTKGISQSELGREYKVAQSTIWRIVNSQRWKHIP
jgi:hypothetical protein